jgi:hypothetical protein
VAGHSSKDGMTKFMGSNSSGNLNGVGFPSIVGGINQQPTVLSFHENSSINSGLK